jgi:membrane protease YdiL (CAAX protease family)
LIVGTPNFGLGPDINFSVEPLVNGALWVGPLGVLAYVLDLVEERVPALQDVTKATQRSVLALLGGKWKPIIAVATASALGLAAGIGEEMLFRGVLQYELAARFGEFASVTVTSIIFGALHAVTPLYALLASLASVYFGWLYTSSGNLAVPIATHALYVLFSCRGFVYSCACYSRVANAFQSPFSLFLFCFCTLSLDSKKGTM